MNTSTLENGLDIGTIREGHFAIEDDDRIRRFSKLIRDENPLHHDREAAMRAGLRGIVAPGIMVLGYVSSTVADWIPGVILVRLNVKFMEPLYAPSCPAVICTVSRRRGRIMESSIAVRNGLEIIAEGACTLLLPQP